MLLHNDGSTTVLLQALVDSPLSAEVLPELDARSITADEHVPRVFAVHGRRDLAVRRSRLRDTTGAVVSENTITFRVNDRDLLMPPAEVPFGLHTRQLGLFERRRILGVGVTAEPFGLLPAGASGRIYEIEFSNRARVLVHEVFNPQFVTADLLGAASGEASSATGVALSASREHHQPRWPRMSDARHARRVLARAAPLVSAQDCRRLQAELAQPAFLLHAGDCAETFRNNTPRSVVNRIALMRAMSDTIASSLGARVLTVGRIAGQYAKPRSTSMEHRDGRALPSYFGDAVNSSEFSEPGRTPNPRNMIRAYQESSKTLSFMARSGVFTSHEALLLDYERPQTRQSPDDGRWYDHSAHLLWIGERTRSLSGPHVGFAQGIANPVAVKIGPTATTGDLVGLHAALNPDNIAGRLTFIFRMGRAHAYERARELLACAASEGLQDRFISDPMHGNTVTSPAGVKTRRIPDIEHELRAFFGACRDSGIAPGGVHLELSGDDVTECVDERVDDTYLATNYRSTCDPRLNPSQSAHLAEIVGELLTTAPQLHLTA